MRLRKLVHIAAAMAIAALPHGSFAETAKKQKAAVENTDDDKTQKPIPFMFGLFNAQKPVLEPLTEEQAENDEKWASLAKKKKYKIKEKYAPTVVRYSGYKPGTIIVDTKEKQLYFMESPTTAIRYGIAVGKEGLNFTGKTRVGDKKVWPRWTPTKAMIERSPGKYKRYSKGMDGGLRNPLGARAIYLYLGRDDTYLRIHGTNQPNTIGTASSNGCFRMHNEHVIDLYERVKMDADVVIL
ncbi:MAG: L,D-transpeptidase [Pseudomonadota bacterium]